MSADPRDPVVLRLRHRRRATGIVLAMARPRALPRQEATIDVEAGDGTVFFYDPPGRAPDAGVVIVPGMALAAHHDIRLHTLAMGLARGGVRGMVLELPDMGALAIRPETRHDLAQRLRRILDDGLVPEGRLGLLGPSFSGSLALRAAAEPAIRDAVRAVLTVGAFSDAERTFHFLFHDPDADPYGRLVLLLNFLDRVQPVSEGLRAALHAAITDTHHDGAPPTLSAALDALAPAEADALRELLTEPAVYGDVGDAIIEGGADVFAAMSVPPIVDRLRCATFVLHGAHDPIVPPSESEALHHALVEAGLPSTLLITPLLDHANIQVGPGVVGDAWRMMGGFAHFLAGLGV